MEKHVFFAFSFIIEGTTEKVFQFMLELHKDALFHLRGR